jgi:hypothetical protein
MQWLKLHDRKNEYTQMVDKYEVRGFVAETIGAEYLIPLVGGPWDSFDEIDFEKLPNQFVLKCTHDSGGVIVCRDKNNLDMHATRQLLENHLKQNYYWNVREWPYKNVKPRIIAEQYMEDGRDAKGLTDYKFFCFSDKPKMIYVSQGLEDHSTACISFFDLDGKQMPFQRSDFKAIDGDMTMPENYSEMICLAERLAKAVACPFVRIDLYSIKGRIYFSEITFTPCGGTLPFKPAIWDKKIGAWIHLPTEEK